MKKYFKLLAKKSLSLLMAVVMLMTCWVWIAPEKAEAASAEEGYYQVRVFVPTFEDPDQREHFEYDRWKILCADGSEQEITHNGGHVAATTNYVIAEGWVNSFPTGVRHEWKQKQYQKDDGCGNTSNEYENGYYLKTPYAQFYDNNNKSWVKFAERTDNYATDGKGADKSVTYTAVNGVEMPKATDYKINGDTTIELEIPLIGSNGTVSHTTPTAATYDQYGVNISDSTEYFISISTDGSVECVEDKESTDYYGVWFKNGSVTANADVQIKHPSVNGTNTVHLIADSGPTKTSIAEITLKYPSYTLTVDSKGSVTTSGFNPTITLSDNSTQTGNWTYAGSYTATAAKYPNGTATAAGYTFKGFWTVKQPTDDGDASVNASEATFATPVSSTDFVNVYGGTEGAEYVEKDGKKYFNAGTQWDPATHKEILGKNTFYGWWIPKDIVVKFYDVDGSFLGTQTAKYGTTPAEGWYPNPKDGYNAGAYDYQGFAKQWRDITGAVITEGTYTFGALETLSLTPIYTNKTYSDKYQVNFVNPADGNNISGNSKEYEYRYILKDTDIPTVAVPSVLVNDAGYSYEFAGWTTQKPAKGNYHTVAKDDSAITENTDWVVREEITYYAIFRSTVKEYLVNFNYTDSTGAAKTESLVVPYGSAISTPNVVNRTYATGGYGYTLEGWDYQTNTGAYVMLGADATVVFENTKVFITTNNLAPGGTPIVFTANYDEGQPTPYTVTFKFKDATGKDKVITDEVYHGYAITQDTVDRVTVPAQYDDGTALYTFSNLWKVTEGTADKAEYTKDEFTSFKPVSHVTFEALYGEGVPFYTVTYIDGNAKYSERVLAGKNVPAWMVEADGVETEYAPSMADTETGKYNFEGWFDAKQTDKDFAQTNGIEYTTSSIVNSDLVLYPQFKFEPFKFTIKFMNFDGTVQLAAAEVEAGKSFEATFVEAQRAAQLRDADETYSYEFIGWDHKVPENFLCEGKDMTYTALYKPNYVYYEANWYNDAASMSGDPLTTTKHTYNSAVYAPAVKLTPDIELKEGETAVFAGWKYLKDGVETDYVRGMKITADMSFYATYKAETNAVTLTTVVGEDEIKYSVEYGKKANIGDPADGYVDATSHNKFTGWYTDAGYETAFDMANTALTADTTIYAKFETAEHSKTMKELVSAPTYYATGSEIIWCACNREETDETVEIPMLTDKVAPTGTIYLGGHSWSSTGTPAYETDNDPISIFVNANADIVITSNDKGDVNDAYNPSGIGKGVAKIRAFAFPANTVLTADNYGAAQSLAVDVYTNDTQDLNNNANFSIKVGDIFVADLAADGSVQYDENNNVKYKDLEDGESYIIYYYVNDKAGNQLNRLVRTAKFTYDNTAADITVDGDSNAATATSTVTYCGKAVIKGIENGSTVLVNGEEVTLTTSGVSGTTAYTITEAGNYVITVTDKAGNTASKKIIVTDGHDEVTTSKEVTCTEDGYEKVTCAVCAKVIKNETIESEGHKYGAEVEVAPTCTEDGYTIKTCSVCGDEVKTPGEAKTGHTYNEDADGNVIYVTVTPSTCKVNGKAEAVCTVCGEGKLEKELDIDTENGHKYGATKVLKATCTQDGEEYQNCKYCYAKKTVKVLEKLNHVGTGTYTKVTTAPTCYAEGEETTYCKGCDAVISTAPVAKVAHTLVLVKYESESDKSTDYPNGYMQYECKATGCTHTEGKTAIAVKATYSVTFVGAGAEGADVVITKTEGESIEATAVADQTKAKDNEYEYTFKGWKAESTGKVVKLPVEVTKNETYTAEFTATKRVYTHTFKLDKDDDAVFATIIGTYNSENKKPAAIPTKEATATETYKFAGWKNALGATTEDFTMTGDATFVADFDSEAITYNVVYLNEGKWFASETVNGGASHIVISDVPTKAYDKDNHYTFAGWTDGDTTYSVGSSITNITSNYRLTAKYTAVAHSYTVVNDADKTWDATCKAEGQKTEICTCGYEKVTVLPLADHSYVDQPDGSKVCSVCGDTVAPEAKEVTITFKDDEGNTLKTVKVEEGKTYTYTAPEKASTAQYDYKFTKWTCDGAADITTAEITVTAGTADAVYTAVYEEITRYYSVTYMDETGKKAIATSKVAFGGTVPAAPAAPEKGYDDKYHYEFSKWSVAVGTVVDGDIMIYPEYTGFEHDWYSKDVGDATCTETGGTKLVCDCGITSEVGEIVPALGHDLKEIGRDDAEIGVPGAIRYKCSRCDHTESKVIPALKALVITVKDGEAVKGGVVVDVQKNGSTVATGVTAGDGKLTLGVAEGTYTVIAEGVEVSATVGAEGANVEINLSADNTGNDDDNSGSQTPSCSCGCHRPGFWGIIFRFFHKVISWFTGRIGCCSCPDPAYG